MKAKGPFDISKIIFDNPNQWDEVTSRDKKKNFFILNRRFAIQYPLQAHLLSHIRINEEEVMNFWKTFLSSKHKKTPYWMYTKGAKKQKESQEKKMDLTHKQIASYAKYVGYDIKSVYDALKFFPKETKKEIKDLEKLEN